MGAKVTLGIFTYNQEKYIKQCILSAVALKYDNLEIIISDDCSTDNTFEVIQDTVSSIQTDHQIVINRNERNLGIAGHFNKIFYDLATGDYFIVIGGDDAFINSFDINAALKYFYQDDSLMILDFNGYIIDENFNITKIASELSFDSITFSIEDLLSFKSISRFAPGRMFKKLLFQNYLPISPECPTEDTVMVVRALMLGRLTRINSLTVYYRRHLNNTSSADNLSKLSNLRIVSQFVSDALHLYDNKLLSDDILLKLMRRFRYEFRRRNLVFSHTNKYTKFFKLFLLKFCYNFPIRV